MKTLLDDITDLQDPESQASKIYARLIAMKGDFFPDETTELQKGLGGLGKTTVKPAEVDDSVRVNV